MLGFFMLRSRKLKLLGPRLCAPNSGLDEGRSRRYPHGPGTGGGRMAARGEDISMVVVGLRLPVVPGNVCDSERAFAVRRFTRSGRFDMETRAAGDKHTIRQEN
jgi:hypothetical protein